jgi:hypothetical protein
MENMEGWTEVTSLSDRDTRTFVRSADVWRTDGGFLLRNGNRVAEFWGDAALCAAVARRMNEVRS